MFGFLPGPYGPPLVYRSICEWQQLALSGVIAPVQVLEQENDGRARRHGLEKGPNLAEHAFE